MDYADYACAKHRHAIGEALAIITQAADAAVRGVPVTNGDDAHLRYTMDH